MQIRYDRDVDALSIVFVEATVTTEELADGIIAEYDARDRLVGLEILDAAMRFGGLDIFREVTLEGVGLRCPTPRLPAARHNDEPKTGQLGGGGDEP